MRTVSFVERVALEFSGNLFPHAMCLGDADNDGLNELVVGDTSGRLSVYKGDGRSPCLSSSSLGMITCVGIGDVFNQGKNFVVSVSGEGLCHVFFLPWLSNPAQDAPAAEETPQPTAIRPTLQQHIPANTKVLLISDIDGDGRCELVVGYTDRVVRALRWEAGAGDCPENPVGHFVQLKKWLLEGQVDSLSTNPRVDGSPELMVSQPGCGYATLLCNWEPGHPNSNWESEASSVSSEAQMRDVIPHQTSARIQNKNVSTHLIANIRQGDMQGEAVKSGLFALCTLDGTLKLMGPDSLLWSVQVDHQLFALAKLDVTSDGSEEVVACAWDGQTYIIDRRRNVVRFHFDENVCTFCAGMYACKGGQNSPCLVYATFNHHIYVYWNVGLQRMESSDLLTTLRSRPAFGEQLARLCLDPEDTARVRELVTELLYGPARAPPLGDKSDVPASAPSSQPSERDA
uniref:KICSTOR complex protein ITFG2 isoform X1 n=2 Tax=Petromyzon marinus TaxID=7757 RepID=A0AAJ7STJ8_PETMA|nr:KICSTOR complex protein ITFG2 isoform X1 [Petromyzon marinus]